MTIVPGLVGELEIVVQPADTADALGNPGVHVLATPRLVALLEQAAIRAVESHLPAGAVTVGTRVDVRHLAATPVGMRARIRATLHEVQGRRYVFTIEGEDERDRIVEGTHERAEVDRGRFLARLAEKARR
ncbi:MAG TPA: thioesterase family protein [Methylomirabilota bacterium]|jgi:fluoroacetyl-CoA thioesterase|nr:thioesterase family protein [Methylomirabilota bacterium]